MDIKELEDRIIAFREERNWTQFHTIKDLLLGLQIECGELSELLLWKSETEIKNIDKNKVSQEIADIYIFLNYIANHFDINLETAVLDKMTINAKKYPVDKAYGSNKKYNEL